MHGYEVNVNFQRGLKKLIILGVLGRITRHDLPLMQDTLYR